MKKTIAILLAVLTITLMLAACTPGGKDNETTVPQGNDTTQTPVGDTTVTPSVAETTATPNDTTVKAQETTGKPQETTGKPQETTGGAVTTTGNVDIAFIDVNDTVTTAYEGYVTGQVNLRSQPDMGATTKTTPIAIGTKLNRTGVYYENAEGSGWSRVVFENVVYYIRNSCIKGMIISVDTTKAVEPGTTSPALDTKALFEQFKAATFKTNGLNSFHTTSTTLTNMVMTGMNVSTQTTDNTDYMLYGKSIQCASESKTMYLGQETISKSYIKDGYVYVDAQGSQYKMKMDIGSVEEISGLTLFNESVYNITGSSVADGITSILITIPAKYINEVYQMEDTEAIDPSKTSDINMVVKINKDGYICEMSMAFSAGITVEGVAAQMELNITQQISEYNKITSITFPDFSGYSEIPLT